MKAIIAITVFTILVFAREAVGHPLSSSFMSHAIQDTNTTLQYASKNTSVNSQGLKSSLTNTNSNAAVKQVVNHLDVTHSQLSI